ncbi:hypothetical protein [Paenarthrobacter sp. NPDC090522]|uniref:hypothetical protein n=1 Tax=Paenarthrobacter sp. NPDC090522 TaxID=3364383 RepID=UPI003821FA4D
MLATVSEMGAMAHALSVLKWGRLKKSVLALALSCLALAGCAGTPAAAPTVTETVTTTVTATATVTAAPAPAPEVTPAAAIPTPAAAATGIIPANVAGMNAQALDDDLEALGFKNIIYNADTGKNRSSAEQLDGDRHR